MAGLSTAGTGEFTIPQSAYLLTDRSDCRIVCHMGNYNTQHLDRAFAALGDPTRRAILARRVAALTIGLIAFAAAGAARAGADKGPYATMAPIEHYLMANQADEIAQARSAAPPSISNDAGVLILDSHGYETAVKGKNGFVCLVQRAWFSGLDDTEFWRSEEHTSELQSHLNLVCR